MELYRVATSDMMGFSNGELFFDSLEKARNEYAKLLIEYRKEETLVKRGDESMLSSPIVKASWTNKKIIKEHMIELWFQCSHEYDEWDTMVEHLRLELIEVM